MTTKRWNLSGPSMIWKRPPGQHLAAIPGDDRRHLIGVFLVFDRIVDLGARNPIGRHFPLPSPLDIHRPMLNMAHGCPAPAGNRTLPRRSDMPISHMEHFLLQTED